MMITTTELRAAWWQPLECQDPDVDMERRLEAVRDAVLIWTLRTHAYDLALELTRWLHEAYGTREAARVLLELRERYEVEP